MKTIIALLAVCIFVPIFILVGGITHTHVQQAPIKRVERIERAVDDAVNRAPTPEELRRVEQRWAEQQAAEQARTPELRCVHISFDAGTAHTRCWQE